MVHRMPTMRDVADAAGVSTATVSRVLNGVADVDEGMTRRVREAADRLSYRPNPLGRALRRRHTDIWSVLVSDIENPFFTAVIRGVEGIALANGKSVWLCNTNEDVQREEIYIRTAVEYQISGVVVATASTARSNLAPLLDARVPVVLIDRAADLHPEVASVLVENEEGASLATTHLAGRGYTRIGCVAGPADVSTAQQRVSGYMTALETLDLPHDDAIIGRDEYTPAGGLRAAERILDATPRPDAIFVVAARMAIGVMQALRARGLSVGRDVAVATFDDEPWTSLVTPSITVVRQPTHELGELAAQVLLRGREPHNAHEVHARLPCELVVRESTPQVGSA